MRMESNGGSFAEWFDFAFIRKRVAKCDNIRGAAEMFNQTYDTAKSYLGKHIDGGFAVVEFSVINPLEVDLNQLFHFLFVFTNGDGGDLLVVADDDCLMTKVESKHRGQVTLTGFVNDDNIKPGSARIKSLCDFVQWHDPNRHCS